MLILNVTGEISNNGSNVRILTNLFLKKNPSGLFLDKNGNINWRRKTKIVK